MKIDNTKSPTPAPTALRLTREADAAVDAGASPNSPARRAHPRAAFTGG